MHSGLYFACVPCDCTTISTFSRRPWLETLRMPLGAELVFRVRQRSRYFAVTTVVVARMMGVGREVQVLAVLEVCSYIIRNKPVAMLEGDMLHMSHHATLHHFSEQANVTGEVQGTCRIHKPHPFTIHSGVSQDRDAKTTVGGGQIIAFFHYLRAQ